jgi:hypothetical protein
MHRILLGILVVTIFAIPASAQTADEIVAKYIKAVGGMEKIQAVKTLRRSGKIIAGGGFELATVQENKRPNMFRQEIVLQGLTGATAYNGKTGWKVEPFQGKKDPEPLAEEEMKQAVEAADFDGPLVNYQQKGNKVEFVGMEPVEGTDAYKLRVTLANGEIRFYYMDTDYYVPIKIESKLIIRGAEIESETILGDYKEVNGWYLPFSFESGSKGSQFKSKVAYDKIEANVPIEDSRFVAPVVGAKPAPAPGASN